MKAGNSRHFCRQLTKNRCEHWPWSGFLEIGSLASNIANSIRERKGKLRKRGTTGAWKGTKLRPGCGGCVHRHGRGSLSMAHNQQAVKQTSKDSRHWCKELSKLGWSYLIPSWEQLCPGLGWCLSVSHWGCSSVIAAGPQHSFIFVVLEISFNVLRLFVFWSINACTVYDVRWTLVYLLCSSFQLCPVPHWTHQQWVHLKQKSYICFGHLQAVEQTK